MIDDFFKKEKNAIDEQLQLYFEAFNKDEKDLLFKDFIGQVEEFILAPKAKRIHPILLIAAFSGIINPIYLEEKIDSLRKVSLAVEFLHSGHLIHDDLIDDDDERRGKPTFHIQLMSEIEPVYKNLEVPNKEEIINLYGRDMSILGGSSSYLIGLDIIKSGNFPEKQKLMAINEYTEAMRNLMKGQIIEEYLNYHNITMTLEQYLSIAELQRASLFEKSTKIGAILAKGNVHYQVNPLSEAMVKVGQAYAIRDDILDVKDDILHQKKKFVYILAVQNTDEAQSKLLNELYRKPDINKSDIKAVEEVFTETNALIIAEHFSKNLVEQAKSHLKDIYPDLNKEQKAFFNEFAEFIYQRKY